MMLMTESQLTQQYVMRKYPCMQSWLDFVNLHTPFTQQFDSVSCTQLASISRAAMKTLDYIDSMEQSASVIRVARMISTMQEIAWRCWTAFSAQRVVASGSRTISISHEALESLTTLSKWDIVFEPSPSSFDPSILFNTVLNGVTV